MGALYSYFYSLFESKRECRIVMVGLDAAGKTSMLYKAKLGETVTTIPTIGFNVETIQFKNICLNVWDVGAHAKLRQLWHHYYSNAAAIIYVIDSNDSERFEEAKEELFNVLQSDELRGVPLLVYANKIDLPYSVPASSITKIFELDRIHDRNWHIQGSCAVTGQGIYEGFDWLSKSI